MLLGKRMSQIHSVLEDEVGNCTPASDAGRGSVLAKKANDVSRVAHVSHHVACATSADAAQTDREDHDTATVYEFYLWCDREQISSGPSAKIASRMPGGLQQPEREAGKDLMPKCSCGWATGGEKIPQSILLS